MNQARSTIIIGGTGFLGEALSFRYRRANRVLTTRHSQPVNTDKASHVWRLDLASEESVREFCDKLHFLPQPINVLYAAASHHPDFVEEHPRQAEFVNIDSLSTIVDAISKVEADLVYVSSDTVFGQGEDTHPFKESDPPSPINEYGRQKARAEKIVLAHNYKVARCSFMFGFSRAAKQHFCDDLSMQLEGGKPVEMMSDSRRSPLSFDQVADYIYKLQANYFGQALGVIHFGSSAPLSKYEVGLYLAKKKGFAKELIVPILFEQQKFFRAPRAKSIVLDTTKLARLMHEDFLTLSI